MLRALVRAFGEGLCFLDPEGRLRLMNQAAEDLTGWSREDLADRPLLPTLLGDDPEAPPTLDGLIGSGRAWRDDEAWLRRRDGSRFPAACRLVPVFDRERLTGAVLAFRDASRQRAAAEELRRAKEAAEAANLAKSRFLANMSHEIRTPLNAVIGMSGLLLGTELSEEHRDSVEIIRSAGTALLSIVSDILDVSKIEAGRLELEAQPFDLRTCIEDSLDLVAADAARAGLELNFEMAEGTPERIEGDPTRLRQVLVNLLSNAVKFTPAGEVSVHVEAQAYEPGAYALHLRVRDTGIGIPESAMGRLFEPFGQVDASTTRRYGGTGLGLAISRRLCELMGGTLWVESREDEGSTFHVRIRARAAEAGGRARMIGRQAALSGRGALVVDDNRNNRRILARLLRSWGMRVRTAESAAAALEQLAADGLPDLALLDMQMPGMDGGSLARRIRRDWPDSQLPMLLLTSLGAEESRVEDVDFAAVLTKPPKLAQLFGAVLEALGEESEAVLDPEPQPRRLDPELARRHPLRILVVEDNAINQKVALKILERLGYRADLASDGQEAIDALDRQGYEVLLMDLQMPNVDGLEAARRIRQELDEARQPQIVAMTAYASPGDRDRCLAAGMDDYMSKPVRIEELVAVLRRCSAELAAERGEAEGLGEDDASEPGSTETAIGSAAGADDAIVFSAMSEGELDQLVDDVRSRLRALLGQPSPEMIAELIEVYLEDVAEHLAGLPGEVEAGQVEAARLRLHALKGSSDNLGARSLARRLARLEALASEGRLADLARSLPGLRRDLDHAAEVLRRELLA